MTRRDHRQGLHDVGAGVFAHLRPDGGRGRVPAPGPAPRTRASLAAAALLTLACSAPHGPGEPADQPGPQPPAAAAAPEPAAKTIHPDVLAARASRQADGTWRFDVTLSSPYDSPERYADAWRILAPDGRELGVRILTHDHANEQPFTRSLEGVVIPPGITSVTVQGRDRLSGWGGATVEVELDAGGADHSGSER